MTGFFAAVAGFFHANGEPDQIEDGFQRTAAKIDAGYRLLADTIDQGNRRLSAACGCRIVPPLVEAVERPNLPAPKRRGRKPQA